jgi:exodeoxyribonuclease V alpha subunit
MTKGSLGTARINELIQQKANPPARDKAEIKINEKIFRLGDRIIHRKNNYDLGVFNGDIGTIASINSETKSCTVEFSSDGRLVTYGQEDLHEIEHAFCITIHKSQGSEFEVVIMPILTQHFRMLYRNLIYTGLTRARKLAVFVGTRRALALAVKNVDTAQRQTALKYLVEAEAGSEQQL